jgi:hypothetical protein
MTFSATSYPLHANDWYGDWTLTEPELARLIVSRVQALGGVARTLTCPVVHL